MYELMQYLINTLFVFIINYYTNKNPNISRLNMLYFVLTTERTIFNGRYAVLETLD